VNRRFVLSDLARRGALCIPYVQSPSQILPISSHPFTKSLEKPPGAFRAHAVHMSVTALELEALTEKIIGCAIEVHRTLGPGLLESVYRECLISELLAERIHFESELQIPLEYKGRRIGSRLKLDLLVEGCIVVELKAVDYLHPVYLAQVITYLKLTGYPAGLLMNFNSTTLRAGLKRLDHPDRYARKKSGAEDSA
jgi:GxxExxY protein